MTDNRWDTLREALHKLKGYMGMFPAGHYNIMLVDNALEALASLKADYTRLEDDNLGLRTDVTELINEKVQLRRDLEAELERIEGERDSLRAELESRGISIIPEPWDRKLKPGLIVPDPEALGHTTSTTCPTCGSGDPFGMLPGCQHAPTRDPWHGHTTEGAPK